MKINFTLTLLLFQIGFISCEKENTLSSQNCMQAPPAKCATIRCTSDGKPVCGCNKVTYGSACEAECAGVISYTYGTCKN